MFIGAQQKQTNYFAKQEKSLCLCLLVVFGSYAIHPDDKDDKIRTEMFGRVGGYKSRDITKRQLAGIDVCTGLHFLSTRIAETTPTIRYARPLPHKRIPSTSHPKIPFLFVPVNLWTVAQIAEAIASPPR